MYPIIDVEEKHLPAIKALFQREIQREYIPEWSADENEYPICMLPLDLGSSIAMLDDDGNIIAYAAYHDSFEEVEHLPWECKGKAAYFHRLLVDHEQRGKGIARRMIEELVNRAKKLGCACYRFVVYPDNEKAIGVYEKMGMRCLCEVESPWAEYGDGGIVLLYEVLI
ncbi:MAG: GNAT family N-acetyltransferase [Christensenellales bacterium]